jgi:hypothetical protein
VNEQDVRALVREAIERHLGRPDSAKLAPYRVEPRPNVDETPEFRKARLQSSYDHPSHILLKVVAGSEVDDGMCVIEPQVRCNHCGFCQSYGH